MVQPALGVLRIVTLASDGTQTNADSVIASFSADGRFVAFDSEATNLVPNDTFLDVGTDAGKKQLPQFFVDNPGVDREAVHKRVAEMAAEFFEKELASPNKKR